MRTSRNPEELVIGELYKLRQPSKTLKALDNYEEHYRRELHPATLETGEALQAWVYMYRQPRPEQCYLASGDWT
jgi:gamma-glutamylcyclotransferase (GGCT)/AIG2-like uncharacterized protein YtfP